MSSAFAFPPATDSTGMPWPPGVYEVELISINEDGRAITTPNPRYATPAGPRAKWEFSVLKVVRLTPVADREQYQANRVLAKKSLTEQTPLLAWTSISMGPKSKMRQYVEALVGRKLGKDEVVNPNNVLGHKAEATIATYLRDDGKEGVGLDHLDPLVNLGDESVPNDLPF